MGGGGGGVMAREAGGVFLTLFAQSPGLLIGYALLKLAVSIAVGLMVAIACVLTWRDASGAPTEADGRFGSNWHWAHRAISKRFDVWSIAANATCTN